ncbi:PHP domain-containing protein [Nitrincola sp.]|uniref:PHP domain-containing protein n=1 Tax=Nitrincola sp. TaxID=1926584 RepID=UPI003A8DCD97
MLLYDLHMHSNASDGVLAPGALVDLCVDKGIQIMALTDHDTLGGIAEASRIAADRGVHFIPGAEFTCLWRRQVLHILGLNLDEQDPDLQAYMLELVAVRDKRAEKIAERLIKKGISADILDQARTIAGDASICRPHFAKALIQGGYVASAKAAFDVYLGQGKVGDVKAEWPDPEHVINIIHHAGGYAVLAHPTKYNMTFTRLRLLFGELQGWQCDAVEVSYPGMNPDQARELLKVVKQYELLVSAGSDFHSPEFGWTAPGRFPVIDVDDRHLLNKLVVNFNVEVGLS